mmetsp:Transcript_57099/g.94875  ORF Transcript_57099/g.94875 Transcript_57099/m.94875 type:complete len:288 (+) Transcript_57099:392-1255(+)
MKLSRDIRQFQIRFRLHRKLQIKHMRMYKLIRALDASLNHFIRLQCLRDNRRLYTFVPPETNVFYNFLDPVQKQLLLLFIRHLLHIRFPWNTRHFVVRYQSLLHAPLTEHGQLVHQVRACLAQNRTDGRVVHKLQVLGVVCHVLIHLIEAVANLFERSFLGFIGCLESTRHFLQLILHLLQVDIVDSVLHQFDAFGIVLNLAMHCLGHCRSVPSFTAAAACTALHFLDTLRHCFERRFLIAQRSIYCSQLIRLLFGTRIIRFELTAECVQFLSNLLERVLVDHLLEL